MARALTIKVPGGTLTARTDGADGTRPIALVNMAQSNLGAWSPIVSELESDHHLVRHDLRGTGASQCDKPFTFESFADDLAAVLDAVGLEKAAIVGAAYGARTAMRFALRHPKRLSALILLDATVGPPATLEVREAGRVRAAARRERAGLAAVKVDASWGLHANPRTAALAYQAHRQPMPWEADIGLIEVPTLVATGDEDPNLPGSQRIAATIPGAEFQKMEMVGHGSPLERPTLAADLIKRFLRLHVIC